MLKKFVLVSVMSALLAACATVQSLQEPEISLSGLTLKSFSFEKQTLGVVLDVYNPNDKKIVISSMDYQSLTAKESEAKAVSRR